MGWIQYELIRTASRVYGKSIRQIRRETGHHRTTIRKALAGTEPKYRRQKEPRAPVMDPVAKIVERWLLGDRQQPRKQRHTARRVYTRLVNEHQFTGAEMSVRRWVREWKAAHGWGRREAVLPLDPAVAREAKVDWGTAWVRMAGQRRQVKLFVMRPRYSGKPFVRAYPWERQEMFFDGHMHAFSYYGGVFLELVYDNLTHGGPTDPAGQAASGAVNGSCLFAATTRLRPSTARRGEDRKKEEPRDWLVLPGATS